MPADRLTYRPGLDGLRGVAVLAVLAFHGGFGLFSGGFLGVSLFFTLSGFLITTLLLREYDQTGRVEIMAFWGRRVRRLLPALLLAFLGIVWFALSVATPTQAQAVADDGPWALLYLANWRLVVDGQNYADLFSTNATSPMLHLWSLAIEEQFYVLLPIFAWFTARRRSGTFAQRLGLAASLGLVVSVMATVLAVRNGYDLSRIYYGTDTRAAELLIGMLAAVAVHHFPQWLDQRASHRSNVVGALSVVALAAMWSVSTETTLWLHRGGFAVHAALAAVVVVLAARPGPLATSLSWTPLVSVGRISYGLYLYHWPIFLWLTPERTGIDGFWLFLLRAAVSIAAATVSLVLIETPIRTGRLQPQRLPLAATAAVAAVLIAVIAVPQPAAETQIVMEAVRSPADAIAASNADTSFFEPTPRAEGEESAPPGFAPTSEALEVAVAELQRPTRVLLVGDSVMVTLGRGLELWADETESAQVVNAAQIGCPIGRGGVQRVYGREFATFEHCDHEAWVPLLEEWDPDLVILLSGVWDLKERQLPDWDSFEVPGSPTYDAWIIDEYRHAIEVLSSTGADVMVVRPPCLQRNDVNGDPVYAEEFEPGRLPAYEAAVIDPLEASGIPVFDLDAVVCPDGQPRATWPGVEDEVRPDGVHFTEVGAASVASVIGPDLLEFAGRR